MELLKWFLIHDTGISINSCLYLYIDYYNKYHWYENEILESLWVSSNANKNSSQTIISDSFQITISSMSLGDSHLLKWKVE